LVLPRAGFTLIDAKAGKLLRKYELEAEEVWAGSQDLRHKMEKQSVTGSLAKDFERDQKQIAEMLTKLGEKIEALDPTLKNTVEKRERASNFTSTNCGARQAWRSIKKRAWSPHTSSTWSRC